MDTNFSPYKLLNKNLVSENRQNGINNISKYLFIFLNSLRKLERFYPNYKTKFLYRCLKGNVKINNDIFNPKIVPYIVGNTKTFWGFISTSPYAQTAYDFLNRGMNDNKSGTIFTLAGKIWGYDITLFNYFGENEILLEPERKFFVEEVMPPINGVIHIRCIYKDTPLVLPVLFNNNYIINDYKSMDPHKFQKTYLKAKALVDERENNISKEKAIYTFKGDGTMDPHKIQKTYLNFK